LNATCCTATATCFANLATSSKSAADSFQLLTLVRTYTAVISNTKRWTDGQTDGRTDGRTDREPSIQPASQPASQTSRQAGKARLHSSPGNGDHVQGVHASLGVVGFLLDQARVYDIHHTLNCDAGFSNVSGHNDSPAIWGPWCKHPCLQHIKLCQGSEKYKVHHL